jgi:hypothetical protein
LYLSVVKIDPGRLEWLGGENRSNLETLMSLNSLTALLARSADQLGMALLLVLGFAAAGAVAVVGL